VSRFDRFIPPGGEGTVSLSVDLRGFQGKVWKSAAITTNDPRHPSFEIMIQGRVRPHIELRPGPFVQFSPAAPAAEEKTVDLVATGQEFKVLKIGHNLKEKVSAQLETISPGRHYRLRITVLKREGSFSGVIRCATDHPQKPEVPIRVSAHFPPPK
jgi:hypothetical protein